MLTELTETERTALIERLAQWSVSLQIGGLVSFMLEINRPVASISGSACIATGSLLDGVTPVSMNALGILLQDDVAVLQLRNRIRELEEQGSGEASAIRQKTVAGNK